MALMDSNLHLQNFNSNNDLNIFKANKSRANHITRKKRFSLKNSNFTIKTFQTRACQDRKQSIRSKTNSFEKKSIIKGVCLQIINKS